MTEAEQIAELRREVAELKEWVRALRTALEAVAAAKSWSPAPYLPPLMPTWAPITTPSAPWNPPWVVTCGGGEALTGGELNGNAGSVFGTQ